MEIAIGLLVLGLLPAVVAASKGRSFLGWWLYGFLIWPVALVHAIVASRVGMPAGRIACPMCHEPIVPTAHVCAHCRSDLDAIRNDPARIAAQRAAELERLDREKASERRLRIVTAILIVAFMAAVAAIVILTGPHPN